MPILAIMWPFTILSLIISDCLDQLLCLENFKHMTLGFAIPVPSSSFILSATLSFFFFYGSLCFPLFFYLFEVSVVFFYFSLIISSFLAIVVHVADCLPLLFC